MVIDWLVGQFSGYAVTYAYPLNVAFKSTALWMRVVCAQVRRVGGVPACNNEECPKVFDANAHV